jgi:murein DD-endopeptidase MepM/ murein hydrolase activator NlpD
LAAYLAWFPKSGPPRAKVARIPAASLPKVAPLAPGFFELYTRERESAIQTAVTIQPNGSLGQALEALGLGSRQRLGSLIDYLTKDDLLKVVQPGDVLRAFWQDRGKTELARLEYQPNLNLSRADLLPLVIMRKPDGGYWHYSPVSPLLTLSTAREGVIDSSLWLAGSKAGLDSGIITSITEILASDIDFMTNIRKGDVFQVLYSREYRDGRPKGDPVIDMVKLTNRGQNYEYYRFVGSNDQVGYYDALGRSSRKAFFATPLQYKRISSQFTMTRLHPIHKVVRPHQGVDYAAPSGTPVSAVADGTVVFCGWNGGYGRLVTIKHDETYTTMYAHLSKFAPGLKKGSAVRQGDLIGNVGATGTATGPHLDFRLKKNNTFIDPVPELAKQQGRRLESGEAQAFAQVVGRIQERMTQYLTTTNAGK